MEKFMLVSLSKDKEVLKESVDLRGLIDRVTDIQEVGSVFESLDVLSENGYRVIIDNTNEPFLYGNEESINEGIKELYAKFKDRFSSEDEFEKAYDEIKQKKMKEGTWNPVSRTSKAQFAAEPAAIKGVSGGTQSRPMSMRQDYSKIKPAQEKTEEQIARDVSIKKSRSTIPSLVSRINNLFNRDPDGYKMLMSQLMQNYKGVQASTQRDKEIDSLAQV